MQREMHHWALETARERWVAARAGGGASASDIGQYDVLMMKMVKMTSLL
jgi:hypothetical protein